jgi:CRP-like cAMP-binding protein
VPYGRSQSEALDFFLKTGARVCLRANEAARDSGEPGERIARLVQGITRTVVLLPDGRRQIVSFSFAGDMLQVDGGTDPFIVEAVTA